MIHSRREQEKKIKMVKLMCYYSCHFLQLHYNTVNQNTNLYITVKLEYVSNFFYLGDTLGVREGVDEQLEL